MRSVVALAVAVCLLAASTDAANFVINLEDTPAYTSPDFTGGGQLFIASGDTVTWVCVGSSLHTVTAENAYLLCSPDPNPSFNGIDTFPGFTCGSVGDQFNYTFANPGRLPFYCTLAGHCGLGMRAVIIVDNAPVTPPVTPSRPAISPTGSNLATRTPTVSPSRFPSSSRTASPSRAPSPSPIACEAQQDQTKRCPELSGWLKPVGAVEIDAYWTNMTKAVCKHCKIAIGTPFVCGYMTGLYALCNVDKVSNDTVYACRGQCDLLNTADSDPDAPCKWNAQSEIPELGTFPYFDCTGLGGRADCRLPCSDPDPDKCPFDPTHITTDEGKDLCKSKPTGLAASAGPIPNWVFLFIGILVLCCCCVCCLIIIIVLFPKQWIIDGKFNPCKWCECCPYYWDM